MLMDCMNTKLRVSNKELFDFLCSSFPSEFPPSPLDSVVWYRVYTCSERSDRDGDSLDWTSGTPSRGRGGNRALLRARGLAGGAATPYLGLSAVLGGGGQTHRLY